LALLADADSLIENARAVTKTQAARACNERRTMLIKKMPDEKKVSEALEALREIEIDALLEAMRLYAIAWTEEKGNNLTDGVTSLSVSPKDEVCMLILLSESLSHMMQGAVEYVLQRAAPTMPEKVSATIVVKVVKSLAAAVKAWELLEKTVDGEDTELPETLIESLGEVVA